ncbi:response regulator transcription factor [Chitinophagaceae bacterium MMS25-I14]
MKKKIFYIEDEAHMARILKDTLERQGFEVLHKKDGSKAIDHISQFAPDICLLDVMLPHVDGFTIGSHIRNVFPRLPIIFLTAKTQTDDIIKGFSSGGTDYVKKPFSMEELIVRINNQLKILSSESSLPEALGEEVQLNSYHFYPGRMELHDGSNVIRLTNRESQILAMLCSHQNKTLDRRTVLHNVWGDDSFFNSRNLDVYIRKLRSYFEADPRIEIITLKGVGYRFVVG